MSEDGSCAYRGTENFRCAIGFCIDDDVYTPALEGAGASDQPVFTAARVKDLPEEIRFIDDLQSVHDYSPSPSKMKEELHKFAKQYDLTVPT